ncbi:MAG: ABC transporter ATP-binding protein/permease [Bacillota bacterium]|nr:ABC transporter ATP-binding protein/permease [Bacillota bacterium]
MKRTFKYVTRYKGLLILPSLAMILSIALEMVSPILSKIIVDDVFLGSKRWLLWYILASIAGIALGRAILGYVKEYLFDVLSARVNEDIKEDLFNHIQKLSHTYFDNVNTGTLMSRIGEDVDNIWRTISFGLRLFVENAMEFITASVILLYLNFYLALICIAIMIPIAFLAMKLEKDIGKVYDSISDQTALINTAAQENIAGVRLVKAFAREKHEILKFLDLNNKNYDLSIEQSRIISKYFPNIEFLTNASTVFMVTIGGIFVMYGKLSLGTLAAFYGYISMLIWPMRMLGWLTNLLAQNNASAKKIYKIMDTEPNIKETENAVELDNLRGSIKFKNVNFSYNEDDVLRNVNLNIKAGSTIAIMGTTGSGKSSLINLAGRYYDVNKGEILIDGTNIKNIDLKSLRSKMALVSQDVFLFSDTIEENIRYGKESATFEEIRNACSLACADDFIEELPDGYKTIIGERGIGLSGGQKQRLSIARALIRDSRILILDDATSALDMDTEFNLLKNLYHMKNKPTTFIIAHRISAVKNADLIIYLQNGEIVEMGNHNELLEKKGKYYETFNLQFKEFSSLEEVV